MKVLTIGDMKFQQPHCWSHAYSSPESDQDGWIVPPSDRMPSPNIGNKITPKFVIVHYSVAPQKSDNNVERIKKWCTNKGKASCHFVILRDGTVWQSVSLLKQAWHAGESEWTDDDGKVYTSLNKWSFGIELDNMGKLTRKGDAFFDSYGSKWTGAVAKYGDTYWEPFRLEQIYALADVIDAIDDRYPGIKVLGHEDIAPKRKIDPGKCFPWDLLQHLIDSTSDPMPMYAASRYVIPFRGQTVSGTQSNPIIRS